jgi:ABC-type oligopeptide transport system substrate-binding subunit
MTAGWIEDIADPDNWYQPYTTGTYGLRQNMPDDIKAQFKALLNEGLTGKTNEDRAATYYKMNQLYYDTAAGIPIVLQTSHAYEQRWVHGVVRNPIFPDFYFYTVSKD